MGASVSTRPSPALIVAAIALTFALVGTSMAADPVAKITKKTVKTIANKQIDKRAPGLSVDKAKTADKAITADRATAADKATTADTATNANELGGVGAAGYVQVKAQRLRTAADDTEDADYTANSDLLLLNNLAPGQYLIQGKVEIDNDGAGAEGVACTLVNTIGPTTLDTMQQTLTPNGVGGQELGFALLGSTSASGAGTDDLAIRCNNPGNDDDADHMKITAQLINN